MPQLLHNTSHPNSALCCMEIVRPARMHLLPIILWERSLCYWCIHRICPEFTLELVLWHSKTYFILVVWNLMSLSFWTYFFKISMLWNIFCTPSQTSSLSIGVLILWFFKKEFYAFQNYSCICTTQLFCKWYCTHWNWR